LDGIAHIRGCIKRVALLAKGMPALPIFTDCAGCVIGDVEDVYLHNIEDKADEALVDNSIFPGVHTAEANDKIPGVDMVHEQTLMLISTLLQLMTAMSNHLWMTLRIVL
jgi:hypothetical protein